MVKGMQQQFVQRLKKPATYLRGETGNNLEIVGLEGKIFPNIFMFVLVSFYQTEICNQ